MSQDQSLPIESAVRPIEIPRVILSGPVLPAASIASLGAQLGGLGLTDEDVSYLISTVQDVARMAAERAANETTLAVIPMLVGFVNDIHRGAAYRIAQRIAAQNGRWSRHDVCANIAMGVASEPARRYKP